MPYPPRTMNGKSESTNDGAAKTAVESAPKSTLSTTSSSGRMRRNERPMSSPRTPPSSSAVRSVSSSSNSPPVPLSSPSLSSLSPKKNKKTTRTIKAKKKKSEENSREKSSRAAEKETSSATAAVTTSPSPTTSKKKTKTTKQKATNNNTRKISVSFFDRSGITMEDSERGSVEDVITVSPIPAARIRDEKEVSLSAPSPSRPSTQSYSQRSNPLRPPPLSPRPGVAGVVDVGTTTGSTTSQPSMSPRFMSERRDERSEPPAVVAITDEDARFHNCIKDEDWDKLEKMLKKFDAKYYKRKQKEAKEQREREEEEAAAAAAAAAAEQSAAHAEANGDNDDDNTDSKVEDTPGRKSPRRLLSFLSPRRSKNGTSDDKGKNIQSSSTSTASAQRELSKRLGPARFLPGALSSRMVVDPSEIVSPLLMIDNTGRTPLHLACMHRAPAPLLLDILKKEKKAAVMKDQMGQLALHHAVQTWQYDHVLEIITKSYPNALKTKDTQGRTPIGLAVQLARERQQDETPELIHGDSAACVLPNLWIQPALTKEEKTWQFQQERIWAKVNYLLKDLMKRRKSVIPSEHGLILEALESGANPNTINRFVSTADKYLLVDDELAGTAIGLCVERQYCLDTLEYVMDNCRQERTTIITDAIHKALNAHYRIGCRPLREGVSPFGKQVIDWAKQQEESLVMSASAVDYNEEKKEDHRGNVASSITEAPPSRRNIRFGGHEDEDIDDNDDYAAEGDEDDESSDEDGNDENEEDEEDTKEESWVGMDKSCRQWWETMNHLVFYCAYGRNYKKTVKPVSSHMLHAALSVPSIPPSLIQLLLIVYPGVRNETCPMYRALPIHIACSRWKYDVFRNDDDGSLDRVLGLMLKQDPNQAYQRHRGRLPVHMALSVGQSWTFLKPFVSVDKRSVGMRDPHSKFFPFQMAALPVSSKNNQLIMRNKFTPTDWRLMSTEQKRFEFEKVENELERRQVGTIFELLRRHPDAVAGRPLHRESTSTSRALRAVGKLSLHYLSFVYGRNSNGGYRIRSDNLKLLRDTILRADIPMELEAWWDKTKELIWSDSEGDIPKSNEYLLHAALFNPESPPLLIELLLQLFPSSASKPLPGTTTFPLHIAAGTTNYLPQPFEPPYGKDSLQLVLEAHKRAAKVRSHGRLPLHICLSRGKGWKEVRQLLKVDTSSLIVEDPHTGLVPFELMASFNIATRENSLRYAAFIERHTRMVDFDCLSTYDKAVLLSKIQKKRQLTQLTCIFELLRHRPSAMMRRRGTYGTSSDLASVVSSAGISVTSRDSSLVTGASAANLVGFLNQDVSPTRSAGDIRELISPVPPLKSLSAFLASQSAGTAPSLETPHSTSRRPSLSYYLSKYTGGGGSAGGGSVYNNYARPIYDDDAMSSANSRTSHVSADGNKNVINSISDTSPGKKVRRGKRPTTIPIVMPDLGIDDDDI